ncbi:hypothetical protein GCM10020001_097040 [Nonomuraea salmonea]
MVVQAEAGPVLAERDGEAAERTFDTIAGIGRQAMTEMRRLLGVLRDEDPPEEGPAGEGAFAPQPGLAQVPDLIDQARRAGVRAELQMDGRSWSLPAGVDLSAYRIVQEALTNVVKHAAGGRGYAYASGTPTATCTSKSTTKAAPPASGRTAAPSATDASATARTGMDQPDRV